MRENEALEKIRFAIDNTWYSRYHLLNTIHDINGILTEAGYPEKKVDKWEYGSP